MADTLKILGQAAPAATNTVDVYTVPGSTSATVSTISICNRAATAGTFRVSVAIAGAALANAQYLYYDQSIDAYSTFTITTGITLAATDKIRFYASSANMSINVFGVEIS
jgi:hypothetical protein